MLRVKDFTGVGPVERGTNCLLELEGQELRENTYRMNNGELHTLIENL